jgi:hypothetical protein
MVLTLESAGALVSGTKPSEVIMATKTIKVLRKFYRDGVIQEIGKILTVSETEAISYVGTNKAAIIPEPLPDVENKKEEPKKPEPKTEASKTKESSVETKKGGKKDDSI